MEIYRHIETIGKLNERLVSSNNPGKMKGEFWEKLTKLEKLYNQCDSMKVFPDTTSLYDGLQQVDVSWKFFINHSEKNMKPLWDDEAKGWEDRNFGNAVYEKCQTYYAKLNDSSEFTKTSLIARFNGDDRLISDDTTNESKSGYLYALLYKPRKVNPDILLITTGSSLQGPRILPTCFLEKLYEVQDKADRLKKLFIQMTELSSTMKFKQILMNEYQAKDLRFYIGHTDTKYSNLAYYLDKNAHPKAKSWKWARNCYTQLHVYFAQLKAESVLTEKKLIKWAVTNHADRVLNTAKARSNDSTTGTVYVAMYQHIAIPQAVKDLLGITNVTSHESDSDMNIASLGQDFEDLNITLSNEDDLDDYTTDEESDEEDEESEEEQEEEEEEDDDDEDDDEEEEEADLGIARPQELLDSLKRSLIKMVSTIVNDETYAQVFG